MSPPARLRNRLSPPAFPRLAARLRSATVTISAIAVVAAAVVLATWINLQARRTADRVSHAIEIRERAERFLGRVSDAETGQLGYLLTGRDAYLTTFAEGRAEAGPELDALAGLVDADPVQKGRALALRETTLRRLSELEQSVELARKGRRDEAVAILREGPDITTMDRLRGIVGDIQQAENVQLHTLQRHEERRRVWASSGIVVALAGLAFTAWQVLRRRQRRSTELALSNAELEQIVSDRTRELEGERLRIEALLRDVNHRVGNNLAMVSALLNVQSRQTREPAVKAALAQAQSRIQAIAAGQRRLRLDIETDAIEARPYMEDLLAEIGKAAEGRPISIALDLDSIRLPGRDAVSYVVIVNELVTNAIKHAFPDGMAGRVTVRLARIEQDGEPALSLSIEDDGIGMPADVQNKGLGQTVITSLLRSMGATMTVRPLEPGSARPGTCVTVVVPKRSQA